MQIITWILGKNLNHLKNNIRYNFVQIEFMKNSKCVTQSIGKNDYFPIIDKKSGFLG